MDASFGHWLAGYLDGEAHFGIARYNGASNCESYGCRVTVTVRGDDMRLLEMIRDTTGLGVVYSYKNERSGKPRQYTQLTIHRRHETRILVDILDEHPLRSKKAEDYALWRQAVLLWQTTLPGGRNKPRGQNDHVVAQMKAIKEEMEAIRAYDHAAVIATVPKPPLGS